MSASLDSSCKILRSAGLDEHSTYPILNEIKKWIDKSGEEWTVQRLKMLKTAFVHKMAYGTFQLPKDSWIKHDANGPKGPFKAIMKIKKPWKALSAFMVYTGFKSKHVTPNQWKKFHDAVNCDRLDPMFTDLYGLEIVKQFKKLPIENFGRFTEIGEISEKSTRVPNWVNGKLKTVPNSFDAIMDTVRAPFISDWMHKRGQFVEELSSMYWRSTHDLPNSYVGTIGLIQEPGYKLRVVANPFPVYQIALSHFGSCLYDALRKIPEDATFNQEKALYDIQDYMKEGGHLVAFDLSNATDRFPLDLTLKCLYKTDLNRDDIDLWSRVSRGTWKSPFGDISWTNGQPLGVYPSFAAFALSHHAVARSVTKGFYRILGDDIVINVEDSQKLLDLYTELECKISLDKSLNSKNLTEFAGRLISKDKIIAQPKWHDISDRSFIDLARQVGPNILGLLKPRQKQVIKLLAEIPNSIHPYGLNWNPKGKPFDQRVAESEETIAKLGIPEDMLPLSSVESKILSDTKTAIQKRNYSKSYNIHIRDAAFAVDSVSLAMAFDRHRKEQENAVPNGNFESRLLKHLRIDFIESAHLLPGWLIKKIPNHSDPRGITTLNIIEKKLGVRSSQRFK